jgi:hypothetical protein
MSDTDQETSMSTETPRKPRKLWATRFDRVVTNYRRHESKAEAYRYVRNDLTNWLVGALRSQFITVYVDERDGRGYQVYERIDLEQLAELDRL